MAGVFVSRRLDRLLIRWREAGIRTIPLADLFLWLLPGGEHS